MTRSTGISGLIFFGSPPRRFIADAHRGQIDDARHAGEVLQDDAGRLEGISTFGGRGGVPGGERFDVVFGDHVAVAVAQDRFEQDANGERERGDLADAGASSLLRR